MVKHSNQPLQIRLTEPVIFLKGPSTGTDFRGRPQAVSLDGQPAMLRGLLTLRLSKPTRIRRIEISLEGKSRTEWPEGIGSRRTETSEEHPIISETTAFFASHRSTSRSNSTRRATSLGPGISFSQYDLDDEDLDDDYSLVDVPDEGEDYNSWAGGDRRDDMGRGRERIRGDPIRSASAMPGMDLRQYDRGAQSRRSSFSREYGPRGILGTADLSLRERGPSPAYTPNPEPFNSLVSGSAVRPSPLRDATLSGREQILSPIVSAAASRNPSDRDDSTETQHRQIRPSAPVLSRAFSSHSVENENASSAGHESSDADGSAIADDDDHDHIHEPNESARPIRPILGGPGYHHSSGNGVRFDDMIRAENSAATPAVAVSQDEKDPNRFGVTEQAKAPEIASHTEEVGNTPADQHRITESPERELDAPPSTQPASRRAASLRTIASQHSASSISLASSDDHSAEIHHPASAAVQPISSTVTPAETPVHSAPPSIRSHPSTDTVNHSGSPGSGPLEVPLDPDLAHGPTMTPPSGSSRRSSLLRESPMMSSNYPHTGSGHSSNSDLIETRAGRRSRLGSASTIVINNDPSFLPSVHRSSLSGTSNLGLGTRGNTHGNRSTSGSTSLASRPSLDHLRSTSSGSHETGDIDGRGRKSGKFSLSAALRGLSQDVKDRVGHHGRTSSKSRSRAESSKTSRHSAEPAPPVPNGSINSSLMTRSGSGTNSHPSSLLNGGSGSIRTGRAESFSQPGEFHPPFGRGGAGRRSRSREPRSGSPVGGDERSESRGRGRHKGMKSLTGALGLGPGGAEEHDGEDIHNWKEFRKGVYNYPISFPIPIDAPPSIHAEFGTVVYKLKATVVRVGALTSNLVETMEVTMIASPQEDDTEETENVLVERQWEEQMRYQIALSGKAFPIGGTIPISIRLMPLMKCKIHRLTVALEEKTDYFAQERKVARHEAPRKFVLLAIQQPETVKGARPDPLLPIMSDSPTAASESPLAPLALQAALSDPPEDFEIEGQPPVDNTFANLMNPMGPWHLEKELVVPDCGTKIKFTSKHEKTNIAVGHWLKVTIRVERGDDVAVDARGRRKQFDIIIETPIKLLDCRVNNQWNSLPTYAAVNPGSTGPIPGVCSVHGRGGGTSTTRIGGTFETIGNATTPSTTHHHKNSVGLPPFIHSREHSHSHSRDSTIAGPSRRASELPAPPPQTEAGGEEDTLLRRNIVYDRLMSGQETETGEIPPSYVEAVASAIRSQSRSQSRARSRLGSMVIGPEGVEGTSVQEVIPDRGMSGSRSRSRLGREID